MRVTCGQSTVSQLRGGGGYDRALSGVDSLIRARASRLPVIVARHFRVNSGYGEDEDGDEGTLSAARVNGDVV